MPNWKPNWKKVLREISGTLSTLESTDRSVRHSYPRGIATPRRSYKRNVCLFWDCNVRIREDHVFCYKHFQDFQKGNVDECPGCGFAKSVQYDVCLDCRNNGRGPSANAGSHGQRSRNWYKPEYSPSWEARDADTNTFYVYLLKLDGGRFYAGQTRELRERLSEHRDSRVTSTAGQNPKLVWFGILPSREAATSTEVEIKKLVDSDPREIRRMVIRFKDLVEELDYT